MSEKSAPKKKRGIQAPAGRVSLNAFAVMCASKGADTTYTTIRIALQEAGIDTGSGVDPVECFPIIMAHYLGDVAKQKLDIERDKARKAASDADTSEINLEVLKGSLVSRSEMKRAVENAIVTYREKIRGMLDLTLQQKKDICEALAELQLEE